MKMCCISDCLKFIFFQMFPQFGQKDKREVTSRRENYFLQIIPSLHCFAWQEQYFSASLNLCSNSVLKCDFRNILFGVSKNPKRLWREEDGQAGRKQTTREKDLACLWSLAVSECVCCILKLQREKEKVVWFSRKMK